EFMKQTIKDIKDHLATLHSVNEIQLQPFYKDDRKGVQKAIATRIKQLDKEQQLLNQYQAMTFYENQILENDGNAMICGIDEEGRGPLAGPVVACAVILNHDHHITRINNSKQLTAKKRKVLE